MLFLVDEDAGTNIGFIFHNLSVLLATWTRLLANILIGEYTYFLASEISIETISSYF